MQIPKEIINILNESFADGNFKVTPEEKAEYKLIYMALRKELTAVRKKYEKKLNPNDLRDEFKYQVQRC